MEWKNNKNTPLSEQFQNTIEKNRRNERKNIKYNTIGIVPK